MSPQQGPAATAIIPQDSSLKLEDLLSPRLIKRAQFTDGSFVQQRSKLVHLAFAQEWNDLRLALLSGSEAVNRKNTTCKDLYLQSYRNDADKALGKLIPLVPSEDVARLYTFSGELADWSDQLDSMLAEDRSERQTTHERPGFTAESHNGSEEEETEKFTAITDGMANCLLEGETWLHGALDSASDATIQKLEARSFVQEVVKQREEMRAQRAERMSRPSTGLSWHQNPMAKRFLTAATAAGSACILGWLAKPALSQWTGTDNTGNEMEGE